MMELFQIRLIRGDIKQNQIDGYLEKINLHMGKYYLVFAINIKSQNGFEEYDEAKQDAIRIDVVENMPDTILAGLMMPPICYARTILCSITADDKAVLENNLLHEYEMLDEYIYGKYGFRISIGVSSIMEELTRFTYGYHECITALKNNDVLNQKNQEEHHEIMFYTDAMLSDTGYMYDKILERELREAIDLGEKEKAFSLIDDFINSLVEHNVVHNEACLSLHRILILCILVAYEAGLQMSKVFNQELADIFSQFNQMYDLNKIRAFLKYKIVDVIIAKLDEYRTSKSTEIMAEIKKLVDESNGDITLTECAEKLGYHPTYIWRIMKVEKNTTFSNYVGEYKLEEAKRLLMETDYSIADISAQLKYTNAQNFIRFFNKLEGVTPGKYRQMYKQNKMQE